MIPPICALCKLPMQPDEGTPGVWRCHKFPTHEYHDDADAELLPTAGARRLAAIDFGMPCPGCGAEMKPVRGTAGAWRCTDNPAHEFLMIDRPDPDQPRPQLEAAGKTALMVKAAPYWLSHLNLTGPISWAPQSNVTDGTRCLLTGPVAHGGGSKSGRSRKKGDKGGKKFTDSAWGEGGTNAK
jgi:hypothetical protein